MGKKKRRGKGGGGKVKSMACVKLSISLSPSLTLFKAVFHYLTVWIFLCEILSVNQVCPHGHKFTFLNAVNNVLEFEQKTEPSIFKKRNNLKKSQNNKEKNPTVLARKKIWNMFAFIYEERI